MQLSWRAGAGDAPTGFMLYVGSAPGRQDLMTVPLGTSTSLSATAANGTYALRLVAMNACGASAWGADAVLTVGPQPAVAASCWRGRGVTASGRAQLV